MIGNYLSALLAKLGWNRGRSRTAARAQVNDDLTEFVHRLRQISPRAWGTPAIVLANIIVFALVALDGGGVLKPDSAVMLRWGANYGPLTSDGQWWRLFSAMFLHFGLLHLALNMWVLYSSGALVERLFGSARFLLLYLVAGLSGSIASTLWNPAALSAGASGAVFGVFGGLFAFMLKPQNRIPVSIMQDQRQSTLAFVVINLIFGATVPGIDNAAHLGGLAGGAIMGLALARPFDIEVRRRSGSASFLIVLIGAVLVLGAISLPITRPSEAARNEQAFRLSQDGFHDQEKSAIDQFNRVLMQLKQPNPDYTAISAQLNSDVIPIWQNVRRQIAEPDLRSDTHLQDLQRAYLAYIDHRHEAIRLIASGLARNSDEQFKAGEAILQRGDADIQAIRTLREAAD